MASNASLPATVSGLDLTQLLQASEGCRLATCCCSSGYDSGRRDSNPRRPAWEAGILPLNYARKRGLRYRRERAGRSMPPGSIPGEPARPSRDGDPGTCGSQSRVPSIGTRYDHHRLCSSVNFLRPADYYRGNPDARLAERRGKSATAKESRRAGRESLAAATNGRCTPRPEPYAIPNRKLPHFE
jgi:hypothetical protein